MSHLILRLRSCELSCWEAIISIKIAQSDARTVGLSLSLLSQLRNMPPFRGFRSERLVFRSVSADDLKFLETLNEDEVGTVNASPFLHQPPGKKSAEGFRDFLIDKCTLGVLICLPPPSSSAQPTPIGQLSIMKPQPLTEHHRTSSIGLSILPAYQRKGYGREAIEWALNWAFQMAGYHRVAIGHFSYNEAAGRLYQDVGFTIEGRKRECLWFNGGWHDLIEMSMLEGEWKERYLDQKA